MLRITLNWLSLKNINSPFSKLVWIENLRALACIMVILLPVSGSWLYKLNGVNSFTWGSVALIHSFTRFCVPVFIMITGALLLKQNGSVIDFYKSSYSRILKPLLFWSICYIMLFVMFDFILGKSSSVVGMISYASIAFLHGAAYHLWYMYLLLALYVFIPFISKIIQSIQLQFLLIILIAWFIMLTLAQYYVSNEFLQFSRFYLGYVGYIIFGYFLYKIQISRQIGIIISILLLILGLVSTFIPAYNFHVNNNENAMSNSFYYLNANIIVLSMGAFILMKSIEFKCNLVSNISKYSFGIYFIHLIFIMLLNKLFTAPQISIVLYILVFTVAVLCLIYFSIVLLSNIPILGRYIE